MGSEPPLRKTGETAAEDDDEELRLAIEASLRDMERARPSAPQGADEIEYKVSFTSYSFVIQLIPATPNFRSVRARIGNDSHIFKHDGSDGGIRGERFAAIPSRPCSGRASLCFGRKIAT